VQSIVFLFFGSFEMSVKYSGVTLVNDAGKLVPVKMFLESRGVSRSSYQTALAVMYEMGKTLSTTDELSGIRTFPADCGLFAAAGGVRVQRVAKSDTKYLVFATDGSFVEVGFGALADAKLLPNFLCVLKVRGSFCAENDVFAEDVAALAAQAEAEKVENLRLTGVLYNSLLAASAEVLRLTTWAADIDAKFELAMTSKDKKGVGDLYNQLQTCNVSLETATIEHTKLIEARNALDDVQKTEFARLENLALQSVESAQLAAIDAGIVEVEVPVLARKPAAKRA
jgi:hypothetical protein